MRDRVRVDSIAFAREAGELRGMLAVADLPRLHDALFDQSGELTYCLMGTVDREGIAFLRLDIVGELLMSCQRCLGPVKFSLSTSRNFELVPATRDLGDPAEEPAGVERIHADANLDVQTLVEDEAILGLPMVARHDSVECAEPPAFSQESEKNSPFDSLSSLKRQ
jgi:uncharacterized protein